MQTAITTGVRIAIGLCLPAAEVMQDRSTRSCTSAPLMRTVSVNKAVPCCRKENPWEYYDESLYSV